jgi:hypothetical protein
MDARIASALVEEDWEAAIELYSQASRSLVLSHLSNLNSLYQAVQETPSALLYSDRAQARIKTEDFLNAASDAAQAIELDPQTAKHHVRRG